MIVSGSEKTNRLIKKLYSTDPREVPIYTIAEAARYVKVHENTLRSWVHGRASQIQGRSRTMPPVIALPSKKSPLLSFINLLEAFNLSSLTRIENLSFKKVRIAIETLKGEKFGFEHPLINQEFLTDSIDLFIQQNDELYNVSRWGQQAIKGIMLTYLKRIVRDEFDRSPLKVYPFAKEIKFDLLKKEPEKKAMLEQAPRHIEVDPLIAFGRPTITGTGIPVESIASRRRAGDNVIFIAKDYGISEEQVQEAIDYEQRPKKAA